MPDSARTLESMKSPPLKNVIAFVLATTAALFARAWLQIRLAATGVDAEIAADLAYLAIPPILLILLFPVLVADRVFIRRQFRRQDLTVKIVLAAVAAGALLRVAWHAHIVAGVAFGAYTVQSEVAVDSAVISFDCPEFPVTLLAILVYSVLVPPIEELTHRAYIQSCLERIGPALAIVTASVIFALFHPMSNWKFATLGGIVIGTLYWTTRSLWAPMIAHAAANLLPQITLRCTDILWSPQPVVTPMWKPAIIAGMTSVGSAACLVWLLSSMRRRRSSSSPGTKQAIAHSPHAR